MMAEDAAGPVAVTGVTTVQTLGSELLERLASKGRSRSTLEAVESHVRVHLDPFFGDTPIEKIGRVEIERFIARERRAGLAAKSIRNYLGTLHSIFDLAIRHELIGHNPCRVVDKPGTASSVDDDIHFLTLDELEAVLRCVQADDVGRVERVLWLTCALVGCGWERREDFAGGTSTGWRPGPASGRPTSAASSRRPSRSEAHAASHSPAASPGTWNFSPAKRRSAATTISSSPIHTQGSR